MNNDTLLNDFAELLLQKELSHEKITALLSRLCDTYSFELGMIYEIDQFNSYNLQEHTLDKHNVLKQAFASSIIDKHIRIQMNDMIIMSWSNPSELTTFFKTEKLLLYPITNSDQLILGFIAFTSNPILTQLNQVQIREMEIIVSLLAKLIDQRMYENKISFAIKSLEDILDNTGIDIYVNDFHNHDILYVNKSMAAPYGGIKAFEGRKCWEILFPGQKGQCEFCPQKKLIDEEGNPTNIYSWDYQRAFDGSWFRVFSAAFHWIDGRTAHVVSSADITDNKKYEALIHHMANYDELTNLPNRRMLIAECKRRIEEASVLEKGYILFFDIDGFKAINDDYGHDAGDEFLVKLAAFFSEIPLLKDSIYRNGGDEFVAVIGGEDISIEHIENLANAILRRFSKPWVLEKGTVKCSTSIGISRYPEDGTNVEDLIKIADQAMYHIKKNGGDGICYGIEKKDFLKLS